MEELDILIEKWDFILQTFKKEYDIQDISFKTWIKPLKIYSLEGNVITLISSEGEMGTVYIERKYLKFIEISICEVMNKEYSVRLISVEEKKEAYDEAVEQISEYQTRILRKKFLLFLLITIM